MVMTALALFYPQDNYRDEHQTHHPRPQAPPVQETTINPQRTPHHSRRPPDPRDRGDPHRSEHPNRTLKTYATQAVPQPLTVATETENAGRVWRTGPYSRQHAENSEHRTINLSPTSSDCSVADLSEVMGLFVFEGVVGEVYC